MRPVTAIRVPFQAAPRQSGVLRVACVLLPALVPSLVGCGLFYRESYRGRNFVLYSDHSRETTDEIGAKVEQIYDSYLFLFEVDENELDRTTILLEGEESAVLDYNYSPNLLGYYIPLLNLISIDTDALRTHRPGSLEQVLLHELAHHFIVTEYPQASQECWLNEGLAGNLEVSLLDGDHREFPLLNPVLLELARRSVVSAEEPVTLKELLGLNWNQFHRSDSKEKYYSLAWSIVYFVLRHVLPHDVPLGKRIECLYRMDREVIVRLESRWTAFLRSFDLTEFLAQLAQYREPDGRLSSRWAIRLMGELRVLDDARALRVLGSLLQDDDSEKRAAAHLSLLKILARNPQVVVLAQPTVLRGLQSVAEFILDENRPARWRRRIMDAITGGQPCQALLTRALVRTLEDPRGGLRAAAAKALARLGTKPTIVNPAFWKEAPPEERLLEIGEWHRWLESRAGG